jgi:glucose uptake protein GlcU
MAVINLLAYWFDFLGIISGSITIILLIMGAYFTKYIPVAEDGR